MADELNMRLRKILHAVVSEYLHTGEAVGSRKVTRRQGIDLSPATVRNVMSDLEDLGLLEQPHTSAGRVPTQSGLRFFIDSLLRVRSLSPKEKDQIRVRCGVDELDFDEVMQRTSKMLSEITRYAGIVLAPSPKRARLHHLEFVPLTPRRYLCILVTTDGHIVNKLVHLEEEVPKSKLESIHNYLNQLLEGLTLEEVRMRVIRELGEEKNLYDAHIAAGLRMSKAALDDAPTDGEVIVSGGSNLLDASGDLEKLARTKDLLRALEEKELIVRLLDTTMTCVQIQVFLGAETEFEPLGDASVVAMPYGPDERPLGAIAVIGPTRMNYGKVMSVVDFTADLVSRMISSR